MSISWKNFAQEIKHYFDQADLLYLGKINYIAIAWRKR